MKIHRTGLPEVLLVEPERHRDDRGWFMESLHVPKLRAAFEAVGAAPPGDFVQHNHSLSHRGVLRGLHLQGPPQPQGKLVRVVRGAAFDVAVDVRPGSPNFGRWVGVDLDADVGLQIWIPAGFAHGMLSLEEGTELLYACTTVHDPRGERAIAWNDPRIGIAWPLHRVGGAPRLSARDAAAPPLEPAHR